MSSPTLPTSHDLLRGRRAFERREWRAAYEALAAAGRPAGSGDGGGLDADDLQRLATAAYLLGRESEFVAALERKHRLHLDAGESAAAARSAFWLGFHLAERGEPARATGWFGRASRLLEGVDGERVEAGYLLVPAGYQRFQAGDYDAALRLGGEAAAIASRFGDADLLALAVHVQGRALLGLGRVEEGLALLDEAMVAVATDELAPQVTGLIYCSVIGACRSVYALARAREWTGALTDWCERQPDMVAYTGECRVYRAELMGIEGAWRAAIAEAERAAEGSATTALAFYQCGEAHRLLGELEAAEEAYRAASRAGREPQPGFALLRLAQGDGEAAAAAIDRALTETDDPLRRARLLPASVEIMLAVDRLEDARRLSAELGEIARAFGTGVLVTMAAHARGAVALAAGEAAAALPELRRAGREWQDLGAPYDAARAQLLLGLACRELGDEDGAAMEIRAARSVFEELGAAPDVERVDALLGEPAARRSHGLTPREREVLALVATGKTNRAIATALFISDRTVARHLSNIFRKLGLSSRASATAFAYEHDLLDPSG